VTSRPLSTDLVAPAAKPAPRLRRSELATPASSAPEMFAKAAASDADMVFLDLEDACAPSQKESARVSVVDALTGLDWGRTIRAMRINGLDTQWCHEDVIEVVTGARDALDVIVLPKARAARDVWWLDVLLTQLEAKLGLSKRIGIEVLIEEATGLANADEIAAASPRLEAVILGAGDLSASLRARVDQNFQPVTAYPGDFWHYARCRVVAAARAAGVDAIDGPYPAYKDPDGYRQEALYAAALGFDGKWVIHPNQIPLANAAFAPSPDEIAWARQAQSEYEEAARNGRGAISLDGQLVDAAHMRHVANVLTRASLAGLSETPEQHVVEG
jgi:citrate lyase subunit beta/citryl-CoA lyase